MNKILQTIFCRLFRYRIDKIMDFTEEDIQYIQRVIKHTKGIVGYVMTPQEKIINGIIINF